MFEKFSVIFVFLKFPLERPPVQILETLLTLVRVMQLPCKTRPQDLMSKDLALSY